MTTTGFQARRQRRGAGLPAWADLRPVQRPAPALPPEHMVTFSLLQPRASHTRPATCTEAGCLNRAHGWVSLIDVNTLRGRAAAQYIRMRSGRTFTAVEDPPDSGAVRFTFPAGQDCFAEHRVSLERPAIHVVQGGDWRGNPRWARRVHTHGADWVDEFANHQIKIAERVGRG